MVNLEAPIDYDVPLTSLIVMFVYQADVGSSEICCWETIVGQEMYKLSWSQMGAEILSVIFVDGTIWIVVSCGPRKIKNYVSRIL